MNKRDFSPWLLAALALMGVLALGLGGRAAAQAETSVLVPGVPAEGTVARAGETARWQMPGVAGQVVSLTVEPLTGDLDPIVRVLDSSGRVLVANDDYAPPTTRAALLEAITLPRIDTYTVEIAGFASTTGRYLLSAYHGFAGPAADAPERWETADIGDGLRLSRGELGAATAAAQGVRVSGIAVPVPAAEAGSAFYASVAFTRIEGDAGWRVGLMLHASAAGYYAVEINDQGEWRFVRREGGRDGGEAIALRDWTTAPPIRAGETAFRLSALGRNGVYSLFYNGAPLGTFGDGELPATGALGVIVGTTASLETTTTAAFENWLVNTPIRVEGAPVRPDQLIVSADGARMAQELVRRADVSGLGALVLSVPESTVQDSRGGVQRQMLGQGTTYTTFALGVTLGFTGGPEGGCGVVFGYTGETSYRLAYLDAAGAYGISTRTADGFTPGLAGQMAGFDPTAQHHLLVTANPSTLALYLDGQYVGSLALAAEQGEIGIAVVNARDVNTVCTARDLWVWRWP
jgi:hypothetical protein